MIVPRRRPFRYLILSLSVLIFFYYFVKPLNEDTDIGLIDVPEKLAWQVKAAQRRKKQLDVKTASKDASAEDKNTRTTSAVDPDATPIDDDTPTPPDASYVEETPERYLSAEEKNLPAFRPPAGQEPLEADTETETSENGTESSVYERPMTNVTSYLIGKHKFYPKHVPSPLYELHEVAKELPRLQHNFKREKSKVRKEREARRESVREAFKFAWSGYRNQSWMEDELMPVSGKGHSAFGGWAATLVDALDTLWIMGMKEEFEEAVKATRDIDFSSSKQGRISVFETTIRYLGGFLGAYDISEGKYPLLLEKAKEVGNLLFCAFDTPNHMPVTSWGWQAALEGANQAASFNTILADFASLSLEFTRLSQLTGDMRYFDGITRISKELHRAQNGTKLPGLWPSTFDANSLNFNYNEFAAGALADSAYEYLPKQYMLLGGNTQLVKYDQMYKSAAKAIVDHLVFQPMLPGDDDVLFAGSARATGIPGQPARSQLDSHASHLSCFIGAMFGVGAKIFEQPEDFETARRLTEGCIWAYASQPSGIMPENFALIPCEKNTECHWDEERYNSTITTLHRPGFEVAGFSENQTMSVDWLLEQTRLARGITEIEDRRYILRPEAIESVFVTYRLTGQSDLPDKAWNMFTSIMDATSTEFANAAVSDVTMPKGEGGQQDNMESFWFAETLKYFFLIFSEPSVVSLDEWVLNTEAHTFRRPRAGEKLVQIPRKSKEQMAKELAKAAKSSEDKVGLKGRKATAA